MGDVNLQIPVSGQPNATEDPKIASNFTALQTVINGNIDHSNLATGAVLELLTTGTTRVVAFGTSNVAFTANNHTGASNVAHNIGRVPLCVICTPQDYGFENVANVAFSVGGLTTTTFTATGEASTTVTGSVSFFWLAIG